MYISFFPRRSFVIASMTAVELVWCFVEAPLLSLPTHPAEQVSASCQPASCQPVVSQCRQVSVSATLMTGLPRRRTSAPVWILLSVSSGLSGLSGLLFCLWCLHGPRRSQNANACMRIRRYAGTLHVCMYMHAAEVNVLARDGETERRLTSSIHLSLLPSFFGRLHFLLSCHVILPSPREQDAQPTSAHMHGPFPLPRLGAQRCRGIVSWPDARQSHL